MHLVEYRERYGYVDITIQLDDEIGMIDGGGSSIRVYIESDDRALGGVVVKLLKKDEEEI